MNKITNQNQNQIKTDSNTNIMIASKQCYIYMNIKITHTTARQTNTMHLQTKPDQTITTSLTKVHQNKIQTNKQQQTQTQNN